MPNGWVHACFDLIAFGEAHFDLHQAKDRACDILGPQHRHVRHGWYRQYNKRWTLREPFPARLCAFIDGIGRKRGDDKAEEVMVSFGHDYLDKVWDTLSASERKYWEAFFFWLLRNPAILKQKFGVNVSVGGILRMIEGKEVWESCPRVRKQYHRLIRYTDKVLEGDQALRETLLRYR